MMKPGTSPAGQAEDRGRRRIIATSIGVSVLLVLGGVAWASGLQGAPGADGAAGGGPANAAATASGPAPGTSPGPATADPVTPTPGPTAAEASAPAEPPAPPDPPAPAEADPAPVDRTGKSDQDLAAIPQPVAAAVDLTSRKAVKGGVSATISEMTAVEGTATGIGEVAGPAVRFKVTVVNDTDAALPLDRAVVDVSYGNDEQPAGQLSGPDRTAFPASVAPGESGVGVFIFAVPLDARDKVKIHFNLEAETPVATFAGTAPA